MESQELSTASEVNFPSTGDNINVVERLVDELCERFQVHEEYYGNILIALTEAANNAIFHGNKLDANKRVFVRYKATPDEFTFTIEDEGAGFDYANVPDPTSPENLEKPNGRGVYLMRHLSDEVEFDDEGRIVTLVFKNLSKEPLDLQQAS